MINTNKFFALSLSLALASVVQAHESHSHAPSTTSQAKIIQLNTKPKTWLTPAGAVVRMKHAEPEITHHFQTFVDSNAIELRWDNEYLFIESNGMPRHEMMVGITAWQQQIPIPQNYTGDNAWRIPLKPVPADKPMSTNTGFFRGAIAIAVNGIPIFNPIIVLKYC